MAVPHNKLYDEIGGMDACRRLSTLFHEKVAADPILARMFPKNLAAPTERLALFLAERLGGPREYTAVRGKQSLGCRHAPFPIGPVEEQAWLGHMAAAMADLGIDKSDLTEFLTTTAATLVDPLIAYYRMPLDDLRLALVADPGLLGRFETGHSLLANAAGMWDVERVELLLDMGALVTAEDTAGHDALYCAANALAPASEAEGASVVRSLIGRGADVNKSNGHGLATPLHMAARRDNVLIADALLVAGADIEARDARGETPLRRAVNCRQPGVVAVLLSHGADPLSRDKHGVTPLEAAKAPLIREMLEMAITRSPDVKRPVRRPHEN